MTSSAHCPLRGPLSVRICSPSARASGPSVLDAAGGVSPTRTCGRRPRLLLLLLLRPVAGASLGWRARDEMDAVRPRACSRPPALRSLPLWPQAGPEGAGALFLPCGLRPSWKCPAWRRRQSPSLCLWVLSWAVEGCTWGHLSAPSDRQFRGAALGWSCRPLEELSSSRARDSLGKPSAAAAGTEVCSGVRAASSSLAVSLGVVGGLCAGELCSAGCAPPDGGGPLPRPRAVRACPWLCAAASPLATKPSPLAGMGAGRGARPGKKAAHLRTSLHRPQVPRPRQARPFGGGRIGGGRATFHSRGRVGRARAARLSHRDPAGVGIALV